MTFAWWLWLSVAVCGALACVDGEVACPCLPEQKCLRNLECTSDNLCDAKECGVPKYVSYFSGNNSCAAWLEYAECVDVTWSEPKPNVVPCAIELRGAPVGACIELAFESQFRESVSLTQLGSSVTLKLTYVPVGQVAGFDKSGTWIVGAQRIDADGKLLFRLDFDGPDKTTQTALRLFTRLCEAAPSTTTSSTGAANPATQAVAPLISSTTAATVAATSSASEFSVAAVTLLLALASCAR